MSTRNDIITEMYKALTGTTTFSATTYYGAPQKGAPRPNVVFRATNDSFNTEWNSMDDTEIRTLEMVIEVRDTPSNPPEDNMDSYIEEVEEAIYTTTGLTQLMRDVITRDIEWDYEDDGDHVFLATVNLEIVYEEDGIYSPDLGTGHFYSVLSADTFYSGSTNLADLIGSDGSGTGTSSITSTAIFVDVGGDDTTGDGSASTPYQTLSRAIQDASSGDTIVVLGGGAFSGSVSGTQGVNIHAPNADLILNDGDKLVMDAGRYTFDIIKRTSGSGEMILSQGATGYANLTASELRDYGTGTTILNESGGILDLRIDQIFVYSDVLLANNDTGNHIHLNAHDIYLSKENCVGIQLNSGGTVVAHIQHMKELGSATGTTTAFEINDGDMNVSTEDIQATTLAIIGDDGNLNIEAQQSTGTIIDSGSGTYQAFLNSQDGNTKITSDLGIQINAPSYRLDGLAGNAGSFITIGSSGELIPTSLDVGAVEWEDTTPAITAFTTTSETDVYEVTLDEEVDAGNWQFSVQLDHPYWRTSTARVYCGATEVYSQSYAGTGQPTISSSLPITGTVANGSTYKVTVETSVGTAYEPNQTTIIDGYLLVQKTGNEATASWGSITGNITGQTDIYNNFLARDNTDVFTPDSDYEPATKKYVDDNAGGGYGDTDVESFLTGGTIDGNIELDAGNLYADSLYINYNGNTTNAILHFPNAGSITYYNSSDRFQFNKDVWIWGDNFRVGGGGNISGDTFYCGSTNLTEVFSGASGTFTSNDGKTITVTNGLITDIS